MLNAMNSDCSDESLAVGFSNTVGMNSDNQCPIRDVAQYVEHDEHISKASIGEHYYTCAECVYWRGLGDML